NALLVGSTFQSACWTVPPRRHLWNRGVRRPRILNRLRSTDITPLRRYCGPIRHPLVVGRLPGVAGYTAYPASVLFATGRGGPVRAKAAGPVAGRLTRRVPPAGWLATARRPGHSE